MPPSNINYPISQSNLKSSDHVGIPNIVNLEWRWAITNWFAKMTTIRIIIPYDELLCHKSSILFIITFHCHLVCHIFNNVPWLTIINHDGLWLPTTNQYSPLLTIISHYHTLLLTGTNHVSHSVAGHPTMSPCCHPSARTSGCHKGASSRVSQPLPHLLRWNQHQGSKLSFLALW